MVATIYMQNGILLAEHESTNMKLFSTAMLVSLVLAASVEEFLFRALPLYFAVGSGKPWIIASAVVVSSVVFGLAHGNQLNIPIQGAGGLVYCITYMKFGGIRKNVIAGTATSSLMHILFNLFVYGVLYSLGQRYI